MRLALMVASGLPSSARRLDGLSRASPWSLLTTWLFERSEYLRPLLAANDAIAQQKLVAIYQLLKVCGEYMALGDTSRRRFLERIRRIEALNEDTMYRAVASEASDMDAVRVMTIHGSKGLEFGAVHLPGLATRYMPTTRQGVRCPPPPTLAQLGIRPQDHDAEEESLFFVGLSRARDYLSLTRAERYTTQNSTPSKFLSSLGGLVRTTTYRGSGTSYVPEIELMPPGIRAAYPEEELDLYLKCPARYRYEVIDGLRGGRDHSAYLRFHSCVYVTVGWLEEAKQNASPVTAAAALEHLAAVWASDGPVGHGFENYYRNAAEAMVAGMAAAVMAETGQYDRHEWTIPLGSRKVLITPDRVILAPDGRVHVQRIRTGRKTKSEPRRPSTRCCGAARPCVIPPGTPSSKHFILRPASAYRCRRNATTNSLKNTLMPWPPSSRATFTPAPMGAAARIASATSCAAPDAANPFRFFPRRIAFSIEGHAWPRKENRCPRRLSSFKSMAAGVLEAELSEAATLGELHDALAAAGIQIDKEALIFLDEGADHLHGHRHEPVPGLKHGCRVHVSRCHRIKTTIHFLDKTAEHEFPPGARVRTVKEWAVREFKMNPKDAAEHVLQICNSTERPASDTPLHQLVHGHACALCFDLVPETRVEG
jgi:hypothetical protein